jgi:hypothetical protein
MARTKAVIGIFADEVNLKEAVKILRDRNFKILDVFTPFPVHGLDPLLGYSQSKLDIAAFSFGALGLLTALGLQVYTQGYDWPLNIGGKPPVAIPSFIPITFELTVLFASLGMVATYLIASRLIPGVEPKIYEPRATSDRFVLVIQEDGMVDEITEYLNQAGVEEIRIDEFVPTKIPTPFKFD